MASDCGGRIGTQRVTLTPNRTQLVGDVESRVVVTVKADNGNDGPIFLVGDKATPASEGYPLYPGEAYAFGGGTNNPRGAKASLYAWAPKSTGAGIVYIITEGI